MSGAPPKDGSPFGAIMIALTSTLFYATTVNAVPVAYSFGASAIFVLAIRYVTNIVFAQSLALGKPQPKTPIPTSERWLLLIISLSLLGQTYGVMVALRELPVSVAITTFFTFPIISYFIERLKKRAWPHMTAVLALMTSLLGVWLMTMSADTDWNIEAILWPLMAAVLQAVAQGAAEGVRAVHGWRLIKITSIIPAVVFVGLAVGEAQSVSYEATFWAFVVAIGFGLATYFLFLSVRANGALRTANMLYLEPVIAIPLSMLIHDDSVSTPQWIGIILIAVGCGIIELHERRNMKRLQAIP